MKLVYGFAWVLAVGSAACVSQVKYDRAVADAASTQQSLQYSIEQAIAHADADQRQIAQLREELERSRQENDVMLQNAARLKIEAHNTLSSLVSDKDTLSRSLEETRAQLAELRRAETAAEERASLAREVDSKCKPMTSTRPKAGASRTR